MHLGCGPPTRYFRSLTGLWTTRAALPSRLWAVGRQKGLAVHALGCGPPKPSFRSGIGLWTARRILPFRHQAASRQKYFRSGIALLATKTVHPFTHCVVERQSIRIQVLVCGRPSWIVRAGAGLCTARMVLPCSHWAVGRQSGASIQALGCGMPEWWLRPIVGSWPAS